MTIGFLFIVHDAAIGRHIGRLKSGVLPEEIRRKPPFSGREFAVSTITLNVHRDDCSTRIENFLRSAATSFDEVIVISDNVFRNFVNPYRAIFFLYFFDNSQRKSNFQNFLHPICTKAIRSFAYLYNMFNNEKNRKILLLPIRNFRAAEMLELCEALSGENFTDFNNKIDSYLARARNRQSPKRSENNASVFICDDDGRYFKYGLERHGRPESQCPPHCDRCLSASKFRFGLRYDEERHYNVSTEGQDISGEFIDCHGLVGSGRGTHVNMFPNDFFVFKT